MIHLLTDHIQRSGVSDAARVARLGLGNPSRVIIVSLFIARGAAIDCCDKAVNLPLFMGAS